jgi:transcriptional regulator with XRE-family HTH domain
MPLVTSEQLRAARAMLRMEQPSLAAAAGVSVNTISRIETIDGPIIARTDTVRRLQRALEAAGITFTDGDGPGVRMRAPDGP